MTTVEDVWRDEWGRLLALLVARYRRLDLAEDGLGDAFEAATRTWPTDGTPANPAAWLLTAARRRILDRLRAEAVAARKLPVLAVEAELTEEAQRVMADPGDRASEQAYDERLRLVLLCAHPALAPESAAALSLRLVMGVATEDIARLFLVPTPTMAARLTRARKRLAAESFDLPAGSDLDDRLALAADVAYLAFTAGYAPGSGSDVLRPAEAAEAIRLARVLRDVAPAGTSSVELDSLLALMLLQHSRRDARVDGGGGLVLLPDQDRSALARRGDRRGPRPPHAVGARAGDAVPPAGADRGRARGRAEQPRAPTGRASPSTTAIWRTSPAPRSSGSTVPSPSRRPTAPTPGSPCWRAWSWAVTACPVPAGSCWSGPAVSRRAAPSWPAPWSCAATPRSAPTSGGCLPDAVE